MIFPKKNSFFLKMICNEFVIQINIKYVYSKNLKKNKK